VQRRYKKPSRPRHRFNEPSSLHDGQLANEKPHHRHAGRYCDGSCNTLTFPFRQLSAATTIQSTIGSIANGALAGGRVGIDPWFQDCGSTKTSTQPLQAYRRDHPARSTQTRLSGHLPMFPGGGTTSLTLAPMKAGTTVTSGAGCCTIILLNSESASQALTMPVAARLHLQTEWVMSLQLLPWSDNNLTKVSLSVKIHYEN